MVLTGVRDTEPPILTLSAAGDIADPWTPFWVVSSEPLPGQQVRPCSGRRRGDAMVLGAPTGMEAFVRVMAKPARLLRYSDEYRVTLDGVTDLDGNPPPPTTALTFTTRAPPPLVAEDGFESVTDATLGGAQVLSGAGAPTIEGARSLYIPPATSIGGRVDADSRCGCRFCPATRSSASPTGASTRATRSASISWSPAWAARSGR